MFPRQPIKLVDCESHGVDSGTELFIVEGDSAAQAVVRIRDARFQAVLPMQGKPMNALKANEGSIRANPFFCALIDAIGTDIGSACQPSSCRYQQMILLFDPDADGIHGGTLVLLFFYRWMRPLLEARRILIIRPPMMEIISDRLEAPLLAYTEEQGASICQQLTRENHSRVIKRRFRGLASFNASTLSEHCVKPTTRNIFPLTLLDAQASIELMSFAGESK